MNVKSTTNTDIKLILKYISTIISWTIFVLLSIIGVLLIYYFISSQLYATKGEKYEPVFSIYTIVSGSMEPTIKVYDVIINTRVNDDKDIKVNDVITFTSTNANTAGMTITHRVIGIRELDDKSLCYVTRGDNNTNEDPSCVASKNVIGKVSAVVPSLGRIQFFLASKFGWLCLIVTPALYIIIKDLYKLIKLSRKHDEEYEYEEENNLNKVIKNNNYNKKKKEKYFELIKEDYYNKEEKTIVKEKNVEKTANKNLDNTIIDLPKLDIEKIGNKEKKKTNLFSFASKQNLDNTILELPKLSLKSDNKEKEELKEKKKTRVFSFKKKQNLDNTIVDLPKLSVDIKDSSDYKVDDEVSGVFDRSTKINEQINDNDFDDIELPKLKD